MLMPNLSSAVPVDVGVDAEGDICGRSHLAGEFVDDLEFGDGFDVKATDVVRQSQAYFPVGFSHPREVHFLGLETRLDGGFYLATAYQVGAQSVVGYFFENKWIAIGLKGIMNHEWITCDVAVDFLQCGVQHIQVIVVKRRWGLVNKIHCEAMMI